jgi:eukaryotic-like serine/threonine-protein kinase
MTEPLDRLKAALADRYAIEREIGAGGMATVYLAEDLRHHRKVAVKVLGPTWRGLGPERFLREIERGGPHPSPHPPLFDSGEADGFLYYVMPYVEGESLRDRLKREKQLPVEDALQISREVADALSYAHSQGVIHRDIKPENILLEAGHAVVADFGIARAVDEAGGETLTGTGHPLGTPAYMSPEQAAGSRDLDGRSDLYSLGCVLYEMLAGHPPFVGTHGGGRGLSAPRPEPPPITSIRPAVPAQVAATLERALAKTPADRFRTSGEMTAALAQPVGGTKVRKPLGRTKALIYSGTILLGLATVAVIASQRGQGGPEFSEDVVVVLPFSNETGDPANDQVGKMLAHRIVEHLDRSGVARPAPAGAAIFSWGAHLERRAKDPRYDPVAALAAEYGAGTVVQGTIFAQGDQIRFVAEFSDRGKARRIRHIDPVVVPSDDHGVSGGMEAVAQRVAAGVVAQLDPRRGGIFARFVPVPSLAAYRDYTSALDAFFRDLEEARELLERAVQRDPFFFPAVTQLAVVHLNLGSLAVADSILKETEEFLDRMGELERTQWNWARAMLDGNREAAYRSMKEFFARTKSSTGAWSLGFEALRMNYPREALEVLSEIDPDTPVMEMVATTGSTSRRLCTSSGSTTGSWRKPGEVASGTPTTPGFCRPSSGPTPPWGASRRSVTWWRRPWSRMPNPPRPFRWRFWSSGPTDTWRRPGPWARGL